MVTPKKNLDYHFEDHSITMILLIWIIAILCLCIYICAIPFHIAASSRSHNNVVEKVFNWKQINIMDAIWMCVSDLWHLISQSQNTTMTSIRNLTIKRLMAIWQKPDFTGTHGLKINWSVAKTDSHLTSKQETNIADYRIAQEKGRFTLSQSIKFQVHSSHNCLRIYGDLVQPFSNFKRAS